ncbi:hypothetical protein F5B19DRAFT_180612 [Rostrohypoxylon terebratum]|nr:hypothetical protein F5B19DRAFT_180612 [Rostrohypoxylon terebratum]
MRISSMSMGVRAFDDTETKIWQNRGGKLFFLFGVNCVPVFSPPFLDLRYLFFDRFSTIWHILIVFYSTPYTRAPMRERYIRGLILLLIPAKVWPDRTTERGYGIFLVMGWYGTDTRA